MGLTEWSLSSITAGGLQAQGQNRDNLVNVLKKKESSKWKICKM